jgi:hypothetical protein
MYCSQCSATYEQRLQCPVCGTRLLYQDSRRRRSSNPVAGWQQTPWGRILIGVVLAQGLSYGLRQLATGVFLALYGDLGAQQALTSAEGLVLMQALQALALLLGALLAGSGQQHGAGLGAVVGVWNGVLVVLTQPLPGQALSSVMLYGQPMLHAAVGVLGGLIGATVWEPLQPTLPVAAPNGGRQKSKKKKISWFAGRVSWVRVAAGSALAVAGTLSASLMLDLMIRFSDGRLSTSGTVDATLMDQIVTWEIKALAVLAGGALAGSNTANGIKQGFFVGLGTAALLAALEVRFIDRWLELTFLIGISSFCLSLVGGWFGSALFPPLLPYKRHRGFGPASM